MEYVDPGLFDTGKKLAEREGCNDYDGLIGMINKKLRKSKEMQKHKEVFSAALKFLDNCRKGELNGVRLNWILYDNQVWIEFPNGLTEICIDNRGVSIYWASMNEDGEYDLLAHLEPLDDYPRIWKNLPDMVD